GQGREVAGRVVDHSRPGPLRASTRERPRRAGVGDRSRQRRDAGARLELNGDLRVVGRLGRLLRPRCPSGGRRERLRPPRPDPRPWYVRAHPSSATSRTTSTSTNPPAQSKYFRRTLDPAPPPRSRGDAPAWSSAALEGDPGSLSVPGV